MKFTLALTGGPERGELVATQEVDERGLQGALGSFPSLWMQPGDVLTITRTE